MSDPLNPDHLITPALRKLDINRSVLDERNNEYRAENYACLCGYFHIKRGALIVAVLELFRSALIMGLSIWLEDKGSAMIHNITLHTIMVIMTLIISTCVCATACSLFYGLSSGNRRWMWAHMIAQPCVFAHLFAVAVYMLTRAGKGKDTEHWALGLAAAIAAALEPWFCLVVFRANKYLKDMALDNRERLMVRAYFTAVKQLLQVPTVDNDRAEFVNRLPLENIEILSDRDLAVSLQR